MALKASIPTSPPGAQEQARTLGRPAMPWLGGGFNAGRKITVYSNPVEVEVRPRPADVAGWGPAVGTLTPDQAGTVTVDLRGRVGRRILIWFTQTTVDGTARVDRVEVRAR